MVVTDEVKNKAQEATAGKETWWDKAHGIYEYVIRHMAYDKTTPGWGRGDTIRACLLGKGNCTDFHSLFISMAQAAAIPSRFKIGFSIPRDPEGKIPGYHCWAEFFDDKQGWVSVDASEAWKNPKMKKHYFGSFDTNKFFVTLGRDIPLMPRQAGEPLNIFIYPYAEVDGKPAEDLKIDKEFYFKSLRP
jgi:transglutaminase-like putative cysteine protease